MISNDDAVDDDVRGRLMLVLAMCSARLPENGSESDAVESRADEERAGLDIVIGIAGVGEVSEMDNRLDKGLCGCDAGCDFLAGEVECDLRKERDWEKPWRDMDFGDRWREDVV